MRSLSTQAAYALGRALILLPVCALPVLAQGTTTPAAPAGAAPAAPSTNVPANGNGPVTGPPAPPGTTTTPAPQQPAPVQPTPPGATAAPVAEAPNYGIQYNGYLEAYYLFQTKNPKFTAAGYTSNNLGYPRVPDVRHNTPSLDYVEFNVFQTPRPYRLGFQATLAAGDNADETTGGNTLGQPINISGLGETRYRNVQQLYLTYALGGNGSGIDVGKWYGSSYEYGNANADYNFSRGYPYVRTPAYNSGVRLYATDALGAKGLTATFAVLRTITDSATAGVEDDNKQPAYQGLLAYTDPKGKFSANGFLALGKDKFGGVNSRVTVAESNLTYNFSANTLAAVDYYYTYTKPNDSFKTTENGGAIYLRQQLTPRTSLALRTSGFDSHSDSADIPNTRPYEVTASYDYKVTKAFLSRLEFRHDEENSKYAGFPVFAGSDGAPTQSRQDTISVSGMFTF